MRLLKNAIILRLHGRVSAPIFPPSSREKPQRNYHSHGEDEPNNKSTTTKNEQCLKRSLCESGVSRDFRAFDNGSRVSAILFIRPEKISNKGRARMTCETVPADDAVATRRQLAILYVRHDLHCVRIVRFFPRTIASTFLLYSCGRVTGNRAASGSGRMDIGIRRSARM